MFDKFVAGLLTSYLGDYFENIDTQQVKVSVWQGNVKLHNIKVRRDALRFWNVPFCVSHGFIDELHVRIPWTRLASESVVIELRKVVLVVEHKIAADYDPAKLREEEQLRKQRDLDSSEEAMLAEWVEKLNAQLSQGGDGAGGADAPSATGAAIGDEAQREDTFSARLKASILNNIKLEVGKFQLCYQSSYPARASGCRRRASAAGAAADPPLVPVHLSLSVDSFKTYACNERYLPDFAGVKLKLLHKALDIKGVRIFTSCNAEGEESSGSPREPRRREGQLVSPFDAFVKLQYQPVPFQSTIPTYLGAIRMEEVHTQLDEQQWRLLLTLMKELWDGAERLETYTKFHPGLGEGRPTTSPRAWWRYAISAVLDERRKARGRACGVRFSWDDYVEMKRKRERYIALYARAKRETLRATAWLAEPSPDEQRELAGLERHLPAITIVVARKGALQRVEMERKEYNRVALERRQQRLQQQQTTSHDAESGSAASPTQSSPPSNIARLSPPPPTQKQPSSSGWFSRWWSSSKADAVARPGGQADAETVFGVLSAEDMAEMREVVELVSAARWTQMQRLAVAKEFGLSAEEMEELTEEASVTERAVEQQQQQQQGSGGLWGKFLFQFVSSSVKFLGNETPFLVMRMDGLSTGVVIANSGDVDGWLTVHSYTVAAEGGLPVVQQRRPLHRGDSPFIPLSSPLLSAVEGAETTDTMSAQTIPTIGSVPLTAQPTAHVPIRKCLDANLAEVLRVASVSLQELGTRLARTATLSISARKTLQQRQAMANAAAAGSGGSQQEEASALLMAAAAEALAASVLVPYDVAVQVAPVDVRLHVPLMEKLVTFFTADAVLTTTTTTTTTTSEADDDSGGADSRGRGEEAARSTSDTSAETLTPAALLLPEPITLTPVEERDLRDPKARLHSLRQYVDASWQWSWRLTLSSVFVYVADAASPSAAAAAASHAAVASEARGGGGCGGVMGQHESPVRGPVVSRAAARTAQEQQQRSSLPTKGERATAIRFDGLVMRNDPASLLTRRARAAASAMVAVSTTSESATPAPDGSPMSVDPFGSRDGDWVDQVHITLAAFSVDCRYGGDGARDRRREEEVDDVDGGSCATASTQSSSTLFRSAISHSSAGGTAQASAEQQQQQPEEGVWHHVLHPTTFVIVAKRNLLGRRQPQFPALSLDMRCVMPANKQGGAVASEPSKLVFSWSRSHLFVICSCLSYVMDFCRQVQRRLVLVRQRVLPREEDEREGSALLRMSEVFTVRVDSLEPEYLCEHNDDAGEDALSAQRAYYKQFSWEAHEQQQAAAQQRHDRQVVEVLPGAMIVHHRQRAACPQVFVELRKGHTHVRCDEGSNTIDVFVEHGGVSHDAARKGVGEATAFLTETLGLPHHAMHNVALLTRYVHDWIHTRTSGEEATAHTGLSVFEKLTESLGVVERASHTVPCHHARFTCESAAQMHAIRQAIAKAAVPFGRYTPSEALLQAAKAEAVPEALKSLRLLHITMQAAAAEIILRDEEGEEEGDDLSGVGAEVPPAGPSRHTIRFAPFQLGYEQLPISQVYTCTTDNFTLDAQAKVLGTSPRVADFPGVLRLTQLDDHGTARKPVVLRTEIHSRPHPLPTLKRTTLAADSADVAIHVNTALLSAMEHLWDCSGILSDRVFGHTIAQCTPFLPWRGGEDREEEEEEEAAVATGDATRKAASPSIETALQAAESRWRESASEGGMWLNMAAVRAGRFFVGVSYPSDGHELDGGLPPLASEDPVLTLEGTDALLRWKQCDAENVTSFSITAPVVQGSDYAGSTEEAQVRRTGRRVRVLWPSSSSSSAAASEGPASPPMPSKMEVTFRSDAAPPTITHSDFVGNSTGESFGSRVTLPHWQDQSLRGFRYTQHLDIAIGKVELLYWHHQLLSLLEVCSRGVVNRATAILQREAFFLPPPSCALAAGERRSSHVGLPAWPRKEEPGPSYDWCGMEKRVVVTGATVHLPVSLDEAVADHPRCSLVARVGQLSLMDTLEGPVSDTGTSSSLLQRSKVSFSPVTLLLLGQQQQQQEQHSLDSATRQSAAAVVVAPCQLDFSIVSPLFRVASALSAVSDKTFDIALSPSAAVAVSGSLADYEALLRFPFIHFVERAWQPAFLWPRPNTRGDPFLAALDREPHEDRLVSQYLLSVPGSLSLSLERALTDGKPPASSLPPPSSSSRREGGGRTCLVLDGVRASLSWRQGGDFSSAYTLRSLEVWDLSHLSREQCAFTSSPREVCDKNFTLLRVRPSRGNADVGVDVRYGWQMERSSGVAVKRITGNVSMGTLEVSLVPRFLFNLRDSFFGLPMRNAVGALLRWPLYTPGQEGETEVSITAASSSTIDGLESVASNYSLRSSCVRLAIPRVADSASSEDTACVWPFFLWSVKDVALAMSEAPTRRGEAAAAAAAAIGEGEGTGLSLHIRAVERIGLFPVDATAPSAAFHPLLIPAAPPAPVTAGQRARADPVMMEEKAEEGQRRGEDLLEELLGMGTSATTTASSSVQKQDTQSQQKGVVGVSEVPQQQQHGETEDWFTCNVSASTGAHAKLAATWVLLPRRGEVDVLLDLWAEGGFRKLPLLSQFREERSFLVAAVAQSVRKSGNNTSWLGESLRNGAASFVCVRPTIAMADHGLYPSTLQDLTHGLLLTFGDNVSLTYTHTCEEDTGGEPAGHEVSLTLPGMRLCPLSHQDSHFIQPFSVGVAFTMHAESDEKKLDVHVEKLLIDVEQRYYEMLLRTLVRQLLDGKNNAARRRALGSEKGSREDAAAAARLSRYLFAADNVGGADEAQEPQRRRERGSSGAEGAEHEKDGKDDCEDNSTAGPSLVHDYLVSRCIASPDHTAKQSFRVYVSLEGLRLCVFSRDTSVYLAHEQAHVLLRTVVSGAEVRDGVPTTPGESVRIRNRFATPSILRVTTTAATAGDGKGAVVDERIFSVNERRELHVRVPTIEMGVTGRQPLFSVASVSTVDAGPLSDGELDKGSVAEDGAEDVEGERELKRELSQLSATSGSSTPFSSRANSSLLMPPDVAVPSRHAGTITSLKLNREESISCHFGAAVVHLDAASVSAAILVLYKPYAEIVLPEYRVKAVKVVDRDVTLTEDLLLSSRAMLRIANTRYNHVTINAAGHNIHFEPGGNGADAALLLLDEGLTLRILNANLHLHGNALEYYTRAGNGSYVLLDRRTSVLHTDPPSPRGSSRGRQQHLMNPEDSLARGTSPPHPGASQVLDELFGDPQRRQAATAAVADTAEAARGKAAPAAPKQVTILHDEDRSTFRKLMGGCRLRVVLPDPTNTISTSTNSSDRAAQSSGDTTVHSSLATPPSSVASLVLTASLKACVVDHTSFPAPSQRWRSLAPPCSSQTDRYGGQQQQEQQRGTAYGGASHTQGTAERRATIDLTELAVENVRGVGRQQERTDLLARWGLKVVLSEEEEEEEGSTKQVGGGGDGPRGEGQRRRRVDIVALSGVEMHLRYSDLLLCTRAMSQAVNSLQFALGNVDTGAFTALFVATPDLGATRPTQTAAARPQESTAHPRSGYGIGKAANAPQTAAYSVTLPYMSVWIINDSATSTNEPLFHLRLEGISTPVWEQGSLSLKCQVLFSLWAEFYDAAASTWSPLVERVAVSARFKSRQNATLEDIHQRKGTTKLSVHVGDVKAYVSPAMLRCVRRLLRLRDDFVDSELRRMFSHELSEDSHTLKQQQDKSPYHGFRIVQDVGNVEVRVGFPQDYSSLASAATTASRDSHSRQGRPRPTSLYDAHDLRYLEEHSFSFPRVNGKEMSRSQQCIAVVLKNSGGSAPAGSGVGDGDGVAQESMDTAMVNVSSRGRCRLPLGPALFQDHLLVDVRVVQSRKVITLRTNIQLVNELPLDVELLAPTLDNSLGSGGGGSSGGKGEEGRLGLLAARSSRNVPMEWMRSRAVFRPVVATRDEGSGTGGSPYEAASLGVCMDSLPDLKNETFLCVCQRKGMGETGRQATLLAKGPDFEIRQGVQRAVYFLFKVSSPRSVAPNSSTAAGSNAAVNDMVDSTARLTAPFFVTNAMGVPIHVTFLTQTVVSGKKLGGLLELSAGTHILHAVASVNINPGERYGVTEVDPFQDVRIDVSLTQSNGGSIGRNGRRAGQPQYPPALIFSPHNKSRCNKRLTILDNIPEKHVSATASFVVNLGYTDNEVTLWCPYWIVNQTPHVVQFCDTSEDARSLIAGLGQHRDDGVLPSATTPFLYNSDRTERLGDKAHLYVRIGHEFPSPSAQGQQSTPLRWSSWSDALNIASIQDASVATCALTRSILATMSYSVELGSGEAASTRIVTFRPRWVILNRTQFPLVFRQSRALVADGGSGRREEERATTDAIVSGGCHVMDLMARVPRPTGNDPHSQPVAPVHLQVRYAGNENSSNNNSGGSSSGVHPSPSASVEGARANCAWSPDFRIDVMGDHIFNVRYEGLVSMSDYWPQERAGVEPTALPPLHPESIVDRGGELYVRRAEADVLRVSCYRAGSLTYVDITRAERPPYVIENRTEYMILVQQRDPRDRGRTTPERATAVYPKTTKEYTWEMPDAPPLMHLWAVNGQAHGREDHGGDGAAAAARRAARHSVRINFDPREVVKNPMQFQQEIDLSDDANALAEAKMLFIRVRGVHGSSYAISITEEPTVDAYRTLPYSQCFYQLDVQSLYTALLAPSDGDAMTGKDIVALLTVKPLLVGFAQGAVAAAADMAHARGAGVRDVQRFDVHLRILQLDDERAEAKEKVVLQLVDTASSTSVKWERTLLRTTPLIYCPVFTVAVAPVELHIEDTFISAAIEYKDALQLAWDDGADAPQRHHVGSPVADATTPAASSSSSPPQTILAVASSVDRTLRLSGGGRAAGDGLSFAECGWAGEALEKAAEVFDKESPPSPPPASENAGKPATWTASQAAAQHGHGAGGNNTKRRRRRRAEKERDDEWRLRTVLIDRLLLQKLYVTISLYRSPGAAGDPMRKHFGVMSLLIRSIKEAKLDWPRVEQRSVCDTIWVLGTRYYAYYKQRMHDQAPNLVHIAGLDTMRGFVSDLLTDYFMLDEGGASGGRTGGGGGGGGREAAPALTKDRAGRRRDANLLLDSSTSPPTTRGPGAAASATRGTSVLILPGTDARPCTTSGGGAALQPPTAPRNITVNGTIVRLTDVALRYPWSVFANAANAHETRLYGALAVRRVLRQQSRMPVYDIYRNNQSAEEVLRQAAQQQQQRRQAENGDGSGSRRSSPQCTRCAEVEAMMALQRFSLSPSASPMDALFHPREGSLTWPEYLHHISWNEFVRSCTDEEVMTYRTAMALSVMGESANVIRLSG